VVVVLQSGGGAGEQSGSDAGERAAAGGPVGGGVATARAWVACGRDLVAENETLGARSFQIMFPNETLDRSKLG
jgi:hypothetical protein